MQQKTIPIAVLLDSLIVLLTEAYAGPSDPRSTWFIDNEPDTGILGIIAKINATEASRSVDLSGNEGTTIAANVEHLRWSLANSNAALRGETFNPNWGESWNLSVADEAGWEHLRSGLKAEYEALLENLKKQTDLPGMYLNGVIALVPHAAYHLGTIRQMIERVRQ